MPLDSDIKKPAIARGGIDIVKLHPLIGAEIRGLDLRYALDADTVNLVRRAWAENTVLLFRDQVLSGGEQLRFAAHFGPIAERLKPPPGVDVDGPTWDHLMMVSDDTDDEGKAVGVLGHGEMWFHTDKCYIERPHRATTRRLG